MFSLPRDSLDVPIPPGPARKRSARLPGQDQPYFRGPYRADLYPGTGQTRGYKGLKEILGNLYGLDIKYFMEVNFDGFQKIVDAIGGVTINVQVPVLDDSYPSDTGRTMRVYIPAGIQHMTGAEALVYARSRHLLGDFDRGARQQRVLTSLREQADVAALIPGIPDLLPGGEGHGANRHSAGRSPASRGFTYDGRHEEHPLLRVLAAALRDADGAGCRAVPLLPGRDQDPARRRQCVQDRPAARRHPRQSRGRERLDLDPQRKRTRQRGHEPRRVSRLLRPERIRSAIRSRRPRQASWARRSPSTTGAEARLTDTIAFLESTFGTKVILKNDPTVPVDVVITTTRQTPTLTPPPTS